MNDNHDTVTIRPEPVNISTEVDAVNSVVNKFVEAKRELEAAVAAITAKAVPRYPADLDVDWDNESEHMWLNAFSCINPTDEFAAEVGREVIGKAMRAHPSRVSMTVNAS